jgi:hypothetical protein
MRERVKALVSFSVLFGFFNGLGHLMTCPKKESGKRSLVKRITY